jgi:hypothetical protein
MNNFWLIVRWGVAVPLLLVWGLCFLVNAYVASRRLRRIWDGPSPLPAIGSIAAIFAVQVLPVHMPATGVWLALLALGPDLIVLCGSAFGHLLQFIFGKHRKYESHPAA